MNTITEEQIEEIVASALHKSTEDIADLLAKNTESYAESLKDTGIQQHSDKLAMMSTAIQISARIIKESLVEILCN